MQIAGSEILNGMNGIDIGQKRIALFSEITYNYKTILRNIAMEIF
jgi:3-phosphoglycerate kinase